MSIKRIITTDKPKREVVKAMKSVGLKEYSLRTLKGKKIKITLRCNLETCRKILKKLERPTSSIT